HSMGAAIAFELARELRQRGRPQPLHLFVSGRRAPHLPAREEPIHALPEAEFMAKLRELNGTPEEVLQHEELMKLLLPILRADVGVNENYEYTEGEPVQAGISAFGGIGDEDVLREDVEGWRQHTAGRFRARMFPGDHFFIHGNKDLVLEAVARDLAEISAAAPRSQPWCRASPQDRWRPAWSSGPARSTSGPCGSTPPPPGSSGWGARSPKTNGRAPTASASSSTGGSTWWGGAPCAPCSPPIWGPVR